METEKPDESKWKFKTLDGVEWTFRITYGTIKSVLSETKFKLTDLFFDDKASAEVLGDGFRLLEVMYATLRQEAEKRGVSFEQFLSVVDGDVIENASTALLEALTDFFPNPRRGILRRALTQVRAANERLLNEDTLAVEKQIETIAMEEVMSQIRTSSGLSSPASAA